MQAPKCSMLFTESHADRHGPATHRKIMRGNNGHDVTLLCGNCAGKILDAWDYLVACGEFTKHNLTGSAEGRTVYVVMNQRAMLQHDAMTCEIVDIVTGVSA